MINICIINGPSLNMLGQRRPEIYGTMTLPEIEEKCRQKGQELGINIKFFQSNSESEIIDTIHSCNNKDCDGIVINAAAYSHTSIAILDALQAIQKPSVEVHLSNLLNRENDFRTKSYTVHGCVGIIMGFGYYSYILGVEAIHHIITTKK